MDDRGILGLGEAQGKGKTGIVNDLPITNSTAKALRRARHLLESIEFVNSIFALPFAYAGALLGTRGVPSLHDLAWITVAMVGARSMALALNRIIDYRYDVRNPNLKMRPTVTGKVGLKEMWAVTFVSSALLLVAALNLNVLAVKLLPVALAVLVGYSFTKRFTWLCHLVLGAALACAPAGAWIAVTGRIEFGAVTLAAAVALWIAGFDVVYACGDVEFDKSMGLQSIPRRFGVKAAVAIAGLFRAGTVAALALTGLLMGLGPAYWTGLALATAFLVYQQTIVFPAHLKGVNPTFYRVNGIFSIVMFVSILVDVIF